MQKNPSGPVCFAMLHLSASSIVFDRLNDENDKLLMLEIVNQSGWKQFSE